MGELKDLYYDDVGDEGDVGEMQNMRGWMSLADEAAGLEDDGEFAFLQYFDMRMDMFDHQEDQEGEEEEGRGGRRAAARMETREVEGELKN